MRICPAVVGAGQCGLGCKGRARLGADLSRLSWWRVRAAWDEGAGARLGADLSACRGGGSVRLGMRAPGLGWVRICLGCPPVSGQGGLGLRRVRARIPAPNCHRTAPRAVGAGLGGAARMPALSRVRCRVSWRTLARVMRHRRANSRHLTQVSPPCSTRETPAIRVRSLARCGWPKAGKSAATRQSTKAWACAVSDIRDDQLGSGERSRAGSQSQASSRDSRPRRAGPLHSAPAGGRGAANGAEPAPSSKASSDVSYDVGRAGNGARAGLLHPKPALTSHGIRGSGERRGACPFIHSQL